jgi:hypothetical protein
MCCLHANIKKKWQAQARPLGLSFIYFLFDAFSIPKTFKKINFII